MKFLFQTGAIKSHLIHKQLHNCFLRFYSKLVRLKVVCGGWEDSEQAFLFQTGAIKRCIKIMMLLVILGFYSKLVRLKG